MTKKEPGGKAPLFDLTELKTSEVSNFIPVHPVTGEDLPLSFDVLHIESKKMQKKLWNMARKKKGFRNRKPEDVEFEEIAKSQVERMSLMIEGCAPFVLDGQTYDYSPENITMLFSRDGYEWLANQISDYANKEQNFLQKA
jgi:hypothetical protein